MLSQVAGLFEERPSHPFRHDGPAWIARLWPMREFARQSALQALALLAAHQIWVQGTDHQHSDPQVWRGSRRRMGRLPSTCSDKGRRCRTFPL